MDKTQFVLDVETDHDFVIFFNGDAVFNSDFPVLIQPEHLQHLEIRGCHGGSEITADTKCQYILKALEQLKMDFEDGKINDEYYMDCPGGNHSLKYSPARHMVVLEPTND